MHIDAHTYAYMHIHAHAGCGPNYCCCTENANAKTDFDANNVLGQTLVNAVCTATQAAGGGTGQTAAVRRKCSGSMTCKDIVNNVLLSTYPTLQN